MGKFIDILGQRFGKLLVISQFGLNKENRVVWNCLCDCGVTVQRTAKAIKKAKELYCGDMHPTKVCTKCKLDKNKATDYHKSSGCKQGIQSMCKECVTAINFDIKDVIKASYNEKMKDPNERIRIRRNGKKSWRKNRHKEVIYKREYNKRADVIERRKRQHLERKKTDMQYVIKRRLRGRIRDCLKSLIGGSYKYNSSLVMLGCDIPFFKNYLESKFEEGMNWERFAYIHVDHIKPCSQFDLTKVEDQMKCFHYSNMQPLWEVDNLKKSYIYDGY